MERRYFVLFYTVSFDFYCRFGIKNINKFWSKAIVCCSSRCNILLWQPFKFSSKTFIKSTTKNLEILKKLVEILNSLWSTTIKVTFANKITPMKRLKCFYFYPMLVSLVKCSLHLIFSFWFLDTFTILQLKFIFVNLLKSLVSKNLLVSGIQTK